MALIYSARGEPFANFRANGQINRRVLNAMPFDTLGEWAKSISLSLEKLLHVLLLRFPEMIALMLDIPFIHESTAHPI
jgi:hypothetical protein